MTVSFASDRGEAPLCQGCGAPLHITLVDLGLQPLANSYVPPERADMPEPVFPLHARVCEVCLLVQVDSVAPPEEIFSDYAYFSSFSDSWLEHCRRYVDDMSERFALGETSRVVEIASNDGYMLQYFVEKGVPVLGIEPAENVAKTAIRRGVPTQVSFFGAETAKDLVERGWAADLLAAKNVLAHVPDINDFVAGVEIVLKPDGVFTVEFPHLLNLIRHVQFDTIYHEHFTYLSLLAVERLFARHGLVVFDVERQPTHGGSLRVFAARAGSGREVKASVREVLDEEIAAGLDRPEGYAHFSERVEAVREGFRKFLAEAHEAGQRVAAYGAAAKGNTFLNYCGVTTSDIDFVVDRNPAKQGRLLPGSHLPIRDPSALDEERPDFIVILPWNLKNELVEQLRHVRAWNARFVTAVPSIEII
jgi:SAM-dependent methyltransferase